jgi:hypothetical protein
MRPRPPISPLRQLSQTVTVAGVKIACTACGTIVETFQVPADHLDPETFVGGCCLRPKGVT